ncbi:hypothetical protein CHS0354_000834 [Potamilus streckersoni]|uniref:ATP-dependent protease subunit HslV n=1 Tax=Potamilus streckersoni TaxID=2493646 RepID=A0AAE0T8B3_9BIVA|nr:hypothetical protein CHS0354_000834 [Potamilus streckersoni]
MTQKILSTTIIGVVKDGSAALASDGQVTLGTTVLKHETKKIRKLFNGTILAGFAGSTSDALTLLEKFEDKLSTYNGRLDRAAVELAKDWRSDKYLRRLEAMLAVLSKEKAFIISGNGDVIEPDDGIVSVGSGSPYALAAARALIKNTNLKPNELYERTMPFGGYEWWSFKAKDISGTYDFSATWYEGCPFSPYHVHDYEKWVKSEKQTPLPKNLDLIGFSFLLYENNNEIINFNKESNKEPLIVNQSPLLINFESSSFNYQNDGISLNIKFSLPYRNKQFIGKFDFLPERKTKQNKDIKIIQHDCNDHVWVIIAPVCRVTGHFHIFSTSKRDETLIKFLGYGLHDRNFGRKPPHRSITTWISGFMRFNHLTVIYTFVKYVKQSVFSKILIFKNGNLLNLLDICNISKAVAFSGHFDGHQRFKNLKYIFAPVRSVIKANTEMIKHISNHLSTSDSSFLKKDANSSTNLTPHYAKQYAGGNEWINKKNTFGFGMAERVFPTKMKSPIRRRYYKLKVWNGSRPSRLFNFYQKMAHWLTPLFESKPTWLNNIK